MSLEKLIIQTSILFVSISSVIGLTLGGLIHDYRSAYVNLGKMLYYSFPFIIASFFALLALVAEDQSKKMKVLIKKLAWAFYITGFIFIMWLAVLASRTELLPQGWIFMMGPTDIIILQLISAGVIFLGFYIARNPKKTLTKKTLATLFTILLVLGVLLMTSGTVQTSSVLKTDIVSLAQRFSNSTVSVGLAQAQQVLVTLQSTDNQATFSYSFMSEREYAKVNASGNVFLANSLAQGSFKNQDTFLTTIQTTGKYILFIQDDWFLGHNVTYSIKVYDTNSTFSFYGLLVVTFGAAGLCSYVSAKDEDEGLDTKEAMPK
jgi:hypothetical protein